MAISKITVNGTTNMDVTDTTAVASDVATGKYFYTAAGVRTAGTASGGNDFIITVSWNDSTQMWEPDCTYADVSAAYTAGKTIVVDLEGVSGEGTSDGEWNDVENVLYYWVHDFDDGVIKEYSYTLDSDGLVGEMIGTYYVLNNQDKSATPTTSTQSVTYDSGYTGLGTVTVNAMPSMTLPSSASGTSSGTRKATISSSTSTQYINIPTGYNGTAQYYQLSAPTAMTLPTTTSSTGSGTSKLAVTPGTANKYINIPTGYNSAAAYYTVNGDANLVAGNIKSGTTIFGVQGTYSGGGSSKNVQVAQSTTRSTSSTYTECISLTCSTAGTYDVYWSTFRSSTSGTWGSQLYLGDTAYGTAQTGSWSNHIQNIHLTGVSISANQEVSVRVRTRGSNYYGYVGTLTIVQSS